MVYVLYDRVVRKAISNYRNHVGVVIETHIWSKVSTSHLLWRVQAAGVCECVCVRATCGAHLSTCTVTHTCPHAQCIHARTHTHQLSCNWCGFVHYQLGGWWRLPASEMRCTCGGDKQWFLWDRQNKTNNNKDWNSRCAINLIWSDTSHTLWSPPIYTLQRVG